MSRTKVLTKSQIEWAWERWNEGYRQEDIAKALDVCARTIFRRFSEMQDNGRVHSFRWIKGKNLPPLIYKG